MSDDLRTVRPMYDRVIVKRDPEDATSAGGIIIPDKAKEKPVRGVVVAVGPGRRDEAGERVPLDVKVGDRVIVGKYSGTDVQEQTGEFLHIREVDILGIVVDLG